MERDVLKRSVALWVKDAMGPVAAAARSGQRVHRGHLPGRLRAAGHPPVDGRPGSALDNAVTGSWHSTLEFKLRSVRAFATRAQARAAVAAWIEDYNYRPQALGLPDDVPGGL